MSVLTLRPNADSTPLDQVVSPAGSHYAVLDEETKNESDLTIVSRTSSGSHSKTDVYGFPDHTTESGTINSVTVKCYCKGSWLGGNTYALAVVPVVKIGSTVYNGTSQLLTGTTALYSHTWETNPATTSAWSWSEIDALLAGDIMNASYAAKLNEAQSQCFQLWVEVDYTEGGSLPLKNVFSRPFSGVFR